MSFTFSVGTTEIDSSLSMIEILGIIVFSIFLMVPLLLFLARRCIARRNRIASTTPIRDVIVRSVMTQQQIDDRKKFLERNLTTCKVIASDGNHDCEADVENDLTTMEISKVKKGDLVLPPHPATGTSKESKELDDDTADDADSRPMCAICVATYEHADEICWSNNKQCYHCFHKPCIEEWLVLHEECPCCRLKFLEPKQCIQEGVINEEGNENETNTSNAE